MRLRQRIPGLPSVLPAVFLLAIVAAAACGGDKSTGPRTDPFFPADFLDSWVMVRDCRLSIDHGFTGIEVYAPASVAEAYVSGTYPFAEGSVIVKAQFPTPDCEGTPTTFVAMRKKAPGANPQSGDWEWQEVDADFKVIQSGFLTSCTSCHASCTEGRDFTCTDP